MTWLGQRDDSMLETPPNPNDSRISIQESWKKTFRNIVILTVGLYILMGVTTTPQTMDPRMSTWQTEQDTNPYMTYNDLSNTDKIKYTLNGWISTLFSLYIIYIIAKLRSTMRHTYSIPETSCLCCYQIGICGNHTRDGIQICGRSVGSIDGSSIPLGWEDVCCSLWCPMCVSAQMARHTVDYHQNQASCCNCVGVHGWDEDDAYVGLEGGVGEGAVLIV